MARGRHSTSRPAGAGAKPAAAPRSVARASVPADGKRVAAIGALLAEAYPDAVVELDHANAYQLLVATILAAQANDKTINTITPALFARFPDAHALAAADQAEVEPMIYKSGFFRNKAKAIIGMARAVVAKHDGQVPETIAELVDLPGVARKTATVVLGEALGKNLGFTVDTHVTRLAARLGFTRHTDPVKIETDLMAVIPQDEWARYAQRLIWHGRRVCHAKAPDCDHCLLAPHCPSAGIAVVEAKANAKAAVAKAIATRRATAAAQVKPQPQPQPQPQLKPKPKLKPQPKPKPEAKRRP